MKNFWKKRLPAILLAMVMVLGMVPAAMAADCPSGQHQWGAWYESTTDSGKHERQCLVSGCSGKETAAHSWSSGYSTDADSHWKTCTVCNVQQPHAAHDFLSGWQSDGSSHWEQCRTCGYHANEGGHIDKDLNGKCDTCGYSMGSPYVTVTFKNGSGTYKTQTNVVKGGTPDNPGPPTYPGSGSYPFVGWVTSNPGSTAAYTGQTYYTSSQVASRAVSSDTTYYAVYQVSASQTITCTAEPGGQEDLDAGDFNEAYQDGKDTSSSIRWVEFSAPKAYTSFEGKLYYDYGGSGEQELSRSDLNNNSFYYSDEDYGEFDLDELTFVADEDADEDTVTIGFTAYRSANSYVEGELILEIEEGGGSGSSATIVYTVDTDDSVAFKKADFNKAFQKKYSSYTVRWVEFTTKDTLSTSTGTVYYDYDGSGEKSFTKSTIDDFSFYYSDEDYGDYALSGLSFVSGSSKRTVTLSFRAYYSSSRYVDGTVEIRVGGSASSSKGDITYKLNPGGEAAFSRTDFNKFFQKETNSTSTIKYVTFSTKDTLSTSAGTVYYDYDGSDEETFTKTTIDDYKFYYSDEDYGDYALNDLSFAAPKTAAKRTVEIAFTAWYSSSKKASGTLIIEIGGTAVSGKADIQYEGAPEKETPFDEEDFNDFFQKTYKNYDVKYVTFKNPENLSSGNGELYLDYGRSYQKKLSTTTLKKAAFYYDEDDIPEDDTNCYLLEDLSFVGGKSFDKTVTMDFTAIYSSSRQVSGTLSITPKAGAVSGGDSGDVLYQTTTGTHVRFRAIDFARFLWSRYPGSTLQYVKLEGVPAAGSLYYNYYGASRYGTAARLQLTASNCAGQAFYVSPSSTSQYLLSELTYVPSGTGYCAAIPFTAYGSGGKTASGKVLIGVTPKTVPEVYGVIVKSSSVNFPAPSIAAAASGGGVTGFSGIRLLRLPSSAQGTVYVGSGTARTADTSTVYGYSSGTWTISQLRFVPKAGYTGNVEIPYAFCDSTGKTLGVGKFCLGVVSVQKKFSDVIASTWCYKYVAELSDASVIDGYGDGSFKPDSKISYGAALKLIMLAAGYPEQKPTDSNPFSGYLAKARAEGIITRSSVDLSKPITRLQVAQLAAGAMKLDKSAVSSVKPFTDTDDLSVQALNEAGIVEGYFSNGTSTYKPNNTLTRGQVSAIVWRMRNYQK